jgi:dihydrofolate reductase
VTNISLIAAMGKDRELGFGNKLPWHLPDDLKRFKALTKGHAVVMGRKTYESIGMPLPERKNIIVTRDINYSAPGCLVVHSIEEALSAAGDDKEIFIIGGGEIYALALPLANKMYLTFVDVKIKANVFFPDFDESEWRVTKTESHERDLKHEYPFVFKIFERK